jgi:hypothetical protein
MDSILLLSTYMLLFRLGYPHIESRGDCTMDGIKIEIKNCCHGWNSPAKDTRVLWTLLYSCTVPGRTVDSTVLYLGVQWTLLYCTGGLWTLLYCPSADCGLYCTWGLCTLLYFTWADCALYTSEPGWTVDSTVLYLGGL